MTDTFPRVFGGACLVSMAVYLGACGKSSPPPGSGPVGPTDPGPVASVVPACPSSISTPLFDVSPVDPSNFIAFRPLGFLSPPIHVFPAKHSAFSMTLPGTTPQAAPVRAPGKVWVKEIWEASFSTGGRNYQVFVYPCTDVRVYFGHVASLSARLMTEMQKTPSTCNSFEDGTGTVTTCRHDNMSLALESGEPWGTGPDSAGIDFGLIDFRRTRAAFVRADHYDFFYPYYASPLDYFTPDARRTLEARTGHVFGTMPRTADPIGGTYMQDVAGTAQGNWFLPGRYHSNTTDLSPFLALVGDYVVPSQRVFSIGTSIPGIGMGLYSFTVEPGGLINRDFGQVRPDGNTYCYDRFLQGQTAGGLPLKQAAGVLLASMPNDTTLRMEFSSATSVCPGGLSMTANATTFER